MSRFTILLQGVYVLDSLKWPKMYILCFTEEMKKVIQVCQDMRVSKWQNLDFWVNYMKTTQFYLQYFIFWGCCEWLTIAIKAVISISYWNIVIIREREFRGGKMTAVKFVHSNTEAWIRTELTNNLTLSILLFSLWGRSQYESKNEIPMWVRWITCTNLLARNIIPQVSADKSSRADSGPHISYQPINILMLFWKKSFGWKCCGFFFLPMTFTDTVAPENKAFFSTQMELPLTRHWDVCWATLKYFFFWKISNILSQQIPSENR